MILENVWDRPTKHHSFYIKGTGFWLLDAWIPVFIRRLDPVDIDQDVDALRGALRDISARKVFLIKSRKDDICDFLLLTSWFFCAMKQPGVQIWAKRKTY
jgi:hypothetical protein